MNTNEHELKRAAEEVSPQLELKQLMQALDLRAGDELVCEFGPTWGRFRVLNNVAFRHAIAAAGVNRFGNLEEPVLLEPRHLRKCAVVCRCKPPLGPNPAAQPIKLPWWRRIFGGGQ